ncbi:MAG: hypothetical protein BWY80_01077 [Firmicutes bacterium ADurb.Bin456]|nr:MAG: hypothetical protein BWY80_01077 [Firmicutes bacterium ADurb.Bin456]
MDEKTAGLKDDGYRIEPGQSFTVDLFRPADAVGVCRLFRAVYGDGYPVKTFIIPERLIEENAARRVISSVARTPKGDIVGHNALYNSAPNQRIYESGAGLVLPEYRRRGGMFVKLIAHGMDVAAKQFGVELIFGEPVCNHRITQKASVFFGCETYALEVDLMPAEAYEKAQSATGRVATLLDFKTLEPKPHAVYLPPVYEQAMCFIYGDLDDGRELLLSAANLPAGRKTGLDVQVFDFARVARIAVTEAGADFAGVFAEQEQALLAKGMAVVQVWLKLSWPWSGEVADALRRRGYFLGGALPRWFGEDGMLMQRVIGRPNWEGIMLYSARAKKLLELVKADWENVSGK